METGLTVEVQEDGEQPKTLSVREEPITIGNTEDCDVQIGPPEPVERKLHSTVLVDDKGVFIRDFTKGTITGTRLEPGQTYRFGNVQVRILRYGSSSPLSSSIVPAHEGAEGGGEKMSSQQPPLATSSRKYFTDRYVLNLGPVAEQTLVSLFGSQELEPHVVTTKLWDFVTTNGLVESVEAPGGEDDLGWLIPHELPETSEHPGLDIEPADGFGEILISFARVGNTTIAEVFGSAQTRASEMYARVWAFIEAHSLYRKTSST